MGSEFNSMLSAFAIDLIGRLAVLVAAAALHPTICHQLSHRRWLGRDAALGLLLGAGAVLPW